MPRKKKPTYLPYREAHAIAKELELRNRREYAIYYKYSTPPKGLPEDPKEVYSKEAGWEGYSVFLGQVLPRAERAKAVPRLTNRVSEENLKTLEEHKQLAKEQGILNKTSWIEYHREHKPEGYARRLAMAFREDFTTWKDFFKQD